MSTSVGSLNSRGTEYHKVDVDNETIRLFVCKALIGTVQTGSTVHIPKRHSSVAISIVMNLAIAEVARRAGEHTA